MKRRTVIAFLIVMCSAFLLAGCSITDVFDGLVDEAVDETIDESSSAVSEVEVKYADRSLAAPAFNEEFGYSVSLTVGDTYTIDGTCSSSDGGVITYQWYVNNINSASGGTAIKGATDAEYTVSADETGSRYYYVVATNNIGNKFNNATSETVGITVYEDGELEAETEEPEAEEAGSEETENEWDENAGEYEGEEEWNDSSDEYYGEEEWNDYSDGYSGEDEWNDSSEEYSGEDEWNDSSEEYSGEEEYYGGGAEG